MKGRHLCFIWLGLSGHVIKAMKQDSTASQKMLRFSLSTPFAVGGAKQ
jgi:hypothetical protein